VKYIQRLFNFGRSKYFHHNHGVVYLNKRYRKTAMTFMSVFILGGGFFITNSFFMPVIKHLQALQRQHPVSVNQTVLAEPVTDGTSLPATHEDATLKELINEKIASYPSSQKWAVFMYDISSGNKVEINKDQSMPAASLYKLFLLEALESRLPFDKWAYTWLPDGTNVKDCVQDMLRNSDSACAEGLSDYIGWGIVDKLSQKNGFTHTSVASPDGRLTSAGDVGELLIRLKKGQVLSDNARRFVFDVLYQQINKEGISKGCGDCRTADKTGQLSDVANDAGVVTYGGHSYVLVVLSQGGSLKQIAEITKTIQTR
jgi:beta-lactamase class A